MNLLLYMYYRFGYNAIVKMNKTRYAISLIIVSNGKMTTQISRRRPVCLGTKSCANEKSHFGAWFYSANDRIAA